jgi:hypothetical protein
MSVELLSDALIVSQDADHVWIKIRQTFSDSLFTWTKLKVPEGKAEDSGEVWNVFRVFQFLIRRDSLSIAESCHPSFRSRHLTTNDGGQHARARQPTRPFSCS